MNNSNEKTTWLCESCGHANDMDSMYCIHCGTRKPDVRYCKNCGTQINSSMSFCHKCGQRLDNQDAGEEKPVKKNHTVIIVLIIIVLFACAVLLIFKDSLFNNNDSPGEDIEVINVDDKFEDADEFDGHHYQLVDESLYWTEARTACEEVSGHLVTITSQEEQNFIVSLIEEEGTKYHYWLGATDEENEGTWKWITGEVFWSGDAYGNAVSGMYNNWLVGQPNNTKYVNLEGQNYLEIQATKGDHGDEEYMTWTDIDDSGVAYNTVSGDDFREAPDYNSTKYYGYIIEWDE